MPSSAVASLIVALTSDNDTFEAAFSKDNSSGSSGNGLVTVPLGHWSQEAAQKRRQEAEEEVCCNRHRPLKRARRDRVFRFTLSPSLSLHEVPGGVSIRSAVGWVSYCGSLLEGVLSLCRSGQWAGSRLRASSNAPSSATAPAQRFASFCTESWESLASCSC